MTSARALARCAARQRCDARDELGSERNELRIEVVPSVSRSDTAGLASSSATSWPPEGRGSQDHRVRGVPPPCSIVRGAT